MNDKLLACDIYDALVLSGQLVANNQHDKVIGAILSGIQQTRGIDDLENELGHLAMKFRGCGNAPDVDEQRKVIVKKYAEVVDKLIAHGHWDEVPAPEDMLPNDCMPDSFDKYWYAKYPPKG